MPLVELIPRKLSWGDSYTAQHISSNGRWRLLRFSDIQSAGFKNGEYNVCHYDRDQCGAAFGPLSLGQTLGFCQALTQMLQGGERVIVEQGPDTAARANGAVMLGAYLILLHHWSAQAVDRVLQLEGRIHFPCAWARQEEGKPQAKSCGLLVSDCWSGLELALKLGWVERFASFDETQLDLAITQYDRLLEAYDAAWLVPAQVMVMADPMTTIADTNPYTCTALCHDGQKSYEIPTPYTFSNTPSRWENSAEDDEEATMEWPVRSADVPQSKLVSTRPAVNSDKKDFGEVVTRPAGNSDKKDFVEVVTRTTTDGTSLHSVCKAYLPADAYFSGSPPLDMVSFLRMHSVVMVVRLNGNREQGLKEIGGSYRPADLRRFGIRHKDFFVKDTMGGLPTCETICDFLELVDGLGMAPKHGPQSEVAEGRPLTEIIHAEEDGDAQAVLSPKDGCQFPALVVHCKSGFGRSAMMACLAMIHVYDIPGRALLGWSRIVRPGAFTTEAQEALLCSLRGRQDLHRFAGFKTESVAGPSVGQACCSVQ